MMHVEFEQLNTSIICTALSNKIPKGISHDEWVFLSLKQGMRASYCLDKLKKKSFFVNVLPGPKYQMSVMV